MITLRIDNNNSNNDNDNDSNNNNNNININKSHNINTNKNHSLQKIRRIITTPPVLPPDLGQELLRRLASTIRG